MSGFGGTARSSFGKQWKLYRWGNRKSGFIPCDTGVKSKWKFDRWSAKLLEKSQPVELNVSRDKIKDNILLHDKAVQTDLSADQITRMEQAHFKLQDRRGELKKNCFWRTCNETIPQPSFILAYLHVRVFSCYSIFSSLLQVQWNIGTERTRHELKHTR